MANRRNLSRGGWLRRPGDEADGDREELARRLKPHELAALRIAARPPPRGKIRLLVC